MFLQVPSRVRSYVFTYIFFCETYRTPALQATLSRKDTHHAQEHSSIIQLHHRPEGWAEFSDTEVTWEDAFGKHRYDPKTRTTTVQYHDPAPVRMPLKGKYRA